MLSDTQLQILARLAEFGTEVENSWDVPRALSLPGLAESLGVVRSALHAPLNALEETEFVSTRLAHVIGGGSRRRTVVHITEEGRKRVEGVGPVSEKLGKIVGPIPDSSILHGREGDISQIIDELSEGGCVILSGLPGVGKTSVARGVVDELISSGLTVKWATCHNYSDPANLAEQWSGKSAPTSLAAIASSISNSRTILVLDEVQELHVRHAAGVEELLSELKRGPSSVLVVVRAPSPLGEMKGYSEIRLGGLTAESGSQIISGLVDENEAAEISTALGGHPLALHLWSPDDVLPARVEAIQEYVEEMVIRRLSEDGTSTLDELCLVPFPLRSEELFENEGIQELDESAILRWADSMVEPHHLIRNVRRGIWRADELADLHSIGASLWAKREGERALQIEAHHRLNSPEFDTEWLSNRLQQIASFDSAAAAVLIEQAVERSGDEVLREGAVDLALERGEGIIAESHLSELSDGPEKKLRQARLARIRGDSQTANELEEEALENLPNAEKIRQKIKSIVRRYDDRLPGKLDPRLANELSESISKISLSQLSDSDRATADLSLNLMKHAIALQTGEISQSAQARGEIETILGSDHPSLISLDLKASLSIRTDGVATLDAIESSRIFLENCDDQLQRISMIHTTLEAVGNEPPSWLIDQHKREVFVEIRDDLAIFRRLSAQLWYWRGVLEPQNRLSHWQESIHRFRTAECSDAARELLDRLTRYV